MSDPASAHEPAGGIGAGGDGVDKRTAGRTRPRSVTLRDVAKAAGTSSMTVSNVLNNRRGEVSRELAETVRRVAGELGYRPHVSARRLRTQRHMAISVALVDPSPAFLSDPLTAEMLAGLTAVLSSENYSTVLQGIAPQNVESAPFLRSNETDGICLILSGPPEQRRKMMKRAASVGQPILLIQETLPDEITDGASVCLDDRRGARAITAAVATPATGRVVMLMPAQQWPAIQAREAGICEGLADAGCTAPLATIVCENEGLDACQAALAADISANGVPDLLIGGNDQMAIAGMKHLQERGLDIPADVQVFGFNGLGFSRYVTPELTTVFSPAYRLGETVGKAMLHRLADGAFRFREQVIPVEPVMRGTTRPSDRELA